MKKFLIALQFLTILPVKIRTNIKEEDFGKALLYFPLVGLIIGLLLSLIATFFSFLPDMVKGSLVLLASVVITGGIHLDGFADTCDGFYGGRTKDKMLQIMRDSRTGVMGVTGIVCLLIFKFALITGIQQEILWKTLVVMGVFARWCQFLACHTCSYARDEGKAKYFMKYNTGKGFIAGSFFTMIIFLLLMGLKGCIIFTISLLPVVLFMNYAKRRIGGMTGDTIGAVNEIAEAAILFFTLILTGVFYGK